MGVRFLGLFALIPATVLLTISFFVLVVARKIESHALKVFGYVVAAFLWLGVTLIVTAGMLVIATGRSPCKGMAKFGNRPMMCMQSPDAAKMSMPR